MVQFGRERPQLPAETLFSEIKIRALNMTSRESTGSRFLWIWVRR